MSFYTITIQNERDDTNFGVFMEPPNFSEDEKPWMNVWYTSFIPHHGTFDLRTGREVFAWAGTVPVRPAPGVIVRSGMALPAKLGTEHLPGSTFQYGIDQEFPVLREIRPSAPQDAFEIHTSDGFPMPNVRYLLGLAKVNGRGQVAPVASTAPGVNLKIAVTPKMKFFVAETEQVAGEIVDYDAVVREAAVVDFTSGPGGGKAFANVIALADGRWEVRYFEAEKDGE